VLQNLLVALVVAVAAGYAAWALAPRALRQRLASRALTWSGTSNRCPKWVRAWLVSLAATSASGCDACGSQPLNKRRSAR
jgi:hypothetical protein